MDSRSTKGTLTAYHEAGHARVGLLCGRSIEKVWINPAAGTGETKFAHWETSPLHQEQELIIAHAGRIAEELLCSKKNWSNELGLDEIGNDLHQIHRLLQALGGDIAEQNVVLRRSEAHARALLTQLQTWVCVEILAEGLLSSPTGEMNCDQIHALIGNMS